MKNYSAGAKGFLEWMKARQPRMYKDIASRFKTGDALGDIDVATVVTDQPMSGSLASTLQQLVTVAGQAYLTKAQMDSQKQLMNLQIARAQQGLLPLDIDPYTYNLGPTARVGLTSDTQKMLMWGGIGLGLLLIVPKLLKK